MVRVTVRDRISCGAWRKTSKSSARRTWPGVSRDSPTLAEVLWWAQATGDLVSESQGNAAQSTVYDVEEG